MDSREIRECLRRIELEKKHGEDAIEMQIAAWEVKHLPFPDWMAPYALEDPMICPKLNIPGGKGCSDPKCKLKHVCLLCQSEAHGAFSRHDGALVCEVHELYIREQDYMKDFGIKSREELLASSELV